MNAMEIEELKKALDICANGMKSCSKSGCPYFGDDNCQRDIAAYALELIDNLEERIAIMEEGKNANP